MRTAAVLALVIGLVCSCSDTETNAYATRAEAEAAGAIARGWVPRGLPDSAYEIREVHDVDSNQRWGLFNFAAADRDALRRILTPEEVSIAGVRSEPPPARIEWWPLIFRRDADPEQLKSAGLQAYRARDERLIVVVNWNQGRAYYWSY